MVTSASQASALDSSFWTCFRCRIGRETVRLIRSQTACAHFLRRASSWTTSLSDRAKAVTKPTARRLGVADSPSGSNSWYPLLPAAHTTWTHWVAANDLAFAG